MKTCLNCNHRFEGKYCPVCGQSADTHRIDWLYLWKDFLYFLHYDNKLPHTLKQLLTRPGESIGEFLKGKRKKHYKPLTLVLFIGGIYGLLFYLSGIHPTNVFGQVIYLSNSLLSTEESVVPKWLLENYAFVELLILLPLFSLASYPVFNKSKYNFVEHLTINAYLSGQRLFLGILTFPILFVFEKSTFLFFIEILVVFLVLGFTFWAYSTLFKEYEKVKGILFSLLAYVIVLIELFLIILFFDLVLGF